MIERIDRKGLTLQNTLDPTSRVFSTFHLKAQVAQDFNTPVDDIPDEPIRKRLHATPGIESIGHDLWRFHATPGTPRNTPGK